MNTDQKQEIKQAIIKKMKTLKKNIKTFAGLSKPVSPDNAIGRLTRMEAINSRSINQASLAKSELILKALNKALDSIETPDFGFCLNCDEPIPHHARSLPLCGVCRETQHGPKLSTPKIRYTLASR